MDLDEFKNVMAVMFALNKADEEESGDEAIEAVTDEEIARQLMFASGVYDPTHVFPEAMKWDGARQMASYPALRTGYRLLCQVERNASLSDKHQNVVKRVLSFLGWDKRTLRRNMPYTAKQLRKSLSHFKDISDSQTGRQATGGSAAGRETDEAAAKMLEERLQSVEIPEDDQAKLDQALLWLFRGVPLVLEEEGEEDD